MSTSKPAGDGQSTRGLLRHSLIYGLVPLIRYVTSFGMTRFYTTVLIAAWSGVRENIELGITAMQQVLGINLFSGMTRIYFDRQKPEDRAKVVTSTTLFITVAAWLISGYLLQHTYGVARILLGRQTKEISNYELHEAVKLMLVLIPFQLSTAAGMYYLQTVKRSSLYSVIQTAKLGLEVSLHLYLMGVLKMGLPGFLWGVLGGEVATSLVVTGWMLVKLKPRFSWTAFAPVFYYALPLCGVGLFQFALHQADRRQIELAFSGTKGFALTGIYGLGYKVGYLVNAMMLGPFLQIWHPWIYGVKDEQERAEHVARVTTWVVLAIGATNLVVICGARELVHLLSGRAEYRVAYQIVPWIAMGYVFWALYNTSQIPLYIAKRTWRILGINAVALAFNLVGNYLLIPRYEITGAAMVTASTFALLAGLGMWASRSEAHVPFELKRLLRVLLIVVTAATLMLVLDHEGDAAFSPVGMAVRGGILLVLLTGMWLGVLHGDEREAIQGWIRARLKRGNGRAA